MIKKFIVKKVTTIFGSGNSSIDSIMYYDKSSNFDWSRQIVNATKFDSKKEALLKLKEKGKSNLKVVYSVDEIYFIN